MMLPLPSLRPFGLAATLLAAAAFALAGAPLAMAAAPASLRVQVVDEAGLPVRDAVVE